MPEPISYPPSAPALVKVSSMSWYPVYEPYQYSSVRNVLPQFVFCPQFSSVTQSCPTLCSPMDHSKPGLPVHHQLLEFTQTHIHPAISSSVIPFSSCPQSLPVSVFSNESTLCMRWPKYGGSALASFLPKNTQD